MTPATVTSKSYRLRRDCQYPRGVKAMFFITTSMTKTKVSTALTTTRRSVCTSPLIHCKK